MSLSFIITVNDCTKFESEGRGMLNDKTKFKISRFENGISFYR